MSIPSSRSGPKGALVALLLGACQGPPAPDAAVCRDVIHRLCLEPRCVAASELGVGADCEEALLANTGCGADDFAFDSPSRDRFLTCRVPLLRAGAHPEQQPACDDVAEVFDRCPDVVRFLKGEAR